MEGPAVSTRRKAEGDVDVKNGPRQKPASCPHASTNYMPTCEHPHMYACPIKGNVLHVTRIDFSATWQLPLFASRESSDLRELSSGPE